ncbi:SulP family inorganic anion transporter [Curvibacter sp. RS43]|uniref:SulP family inorganic anion transporter n=1 Tax=Curvibacter microcysteis TaxID=3026419 RepID=A0ABT5MAS5_9BURK|nr:MULTISPECIES: SulP family inorganic anion transporter [unclassified Curvibacter]MDD0811368.1 SulP family inorganic anion transporter [Curvibacter sp. RS43]MDD0813531.1 SulP family inorganic anion transporter [Curvibacter sp. HBC28]
MNDTPAAPRPQPTPGARAWLRHRGPDLLAGVSVAGVLLPEAVAYAAIAGVEPAHALLAALVGLCVYPLLGTSRFAIVAPTSSAAAVFASAVTLGGPAMGYALVALTGALFLVAAGLRAGFIGAFISRPVLRGFAWALAVTIVIKQLPHLTGLAAASSQVLPLLAQQLQAWPQWHGPSLVLGVGALALWLLLHHGLARWLFVPTSLLVLGLGVGLSAALGLDRQGVALVGPIAGLSLQGPLQGLSTELWLRAAEIAPALLLILFAESWGSVRSLALQNGDTVQANRELLALGAANLLCGLVQGLPVGAGFSAASASQAAGGRSRWAGVAAAAALALMLWWARPALALLPLPVLAAVVAAILSHKLWPQAMIATLRLGSDAWLALVAGAGVLLFGVLFGMLLAVGLSLLLALRRFAQPVLSELGQLPGTRDFLDCERHPETRVQPGILVVRPEEPLFFANAEQVFQQVRQRALARPTQVVVLSLEMSDDLDSSAMESLAELSAALRQQGCLLLLARVKDKPREALLRLGLADGGGYGHVALYWSVDDAVRAAQRLRQRPVAATAAPAPSA